MNNLPSGIQLRDSGINTALGHANDVIENWADRAMQYLIAFLQTHPGKFMAEQVRQFAIDGGLPKPPNNRAWGGIFQSASRSKLIKQVGYARVKNPRAHCANAALWERV